MKYLVNRETKEHTIAPEWAIEELCLINGYILVEADDEGWIPWSGGECPLPEQSMVAVKYHGGRCESAVEAHCYDWNMVTSRVYNVAAYRPILSETSEKVENYTVGLPHSAFWKTEQSVFDRLKSAIAASESIPGIIAEIDALLPEGYNVVKRPTHRNVEI